MGNVKTFDITSMTEYTFISKDDTTGLLSNKEICWKEGADQLISKSYAEGTQPLEIYYHSSYLYYEQNYSYGFTSCVAEMGGLVGLALGISFADATGFVKWFQAKINKH